MKRILVALLALSACVDRGAVVVNPTQPAAQPAAAGPLTYDPVSPSALAKVKHDGSLQGNGNNTSLLGIVACTIAGQSLVWNTSTGWGCATAGGGTFPSGSALVQETGTANTGASYAGSTGTACSAGQMLTNGALSAAGVWTNTCTQELPASTVDLLVGASGSAVAYAGSTGTACSAGQVTTNTAESAAGVITNTCTAIGTAGGTTGTGTSGQVAVWNSTTGITGYTGLTSDSSGDLTAANTVVASFTAGTISPSSISGTLNDWAPTGLAGAKYIFVGTTGATTLNGISATGVSTGRELCLINTGTGAITVNNQNAGSLAANRLTLVTGVVATLSASSSEPMCFVYNSSTEWTQSSGATNLPSLSINNGTASIAQNGNATFVTTTITDLTVSTGAFNNLNAVTVHHPASAQTQGEYSILADHTSTYNTTSGALMAITLSASNTASRSSGTNALTNFGGYFVATGAQNNISADVDGTIGTTLGSAAAADLVANDTTAEAAGVGGNLQFDMCIAAATCAQAGTLGAEIKLSKTNSTASDSNGDLIISTNNAGTMTKAFTFGHDQSFVGAGAGTVSKDFTLSGAGAHWHATGTGPSVSSCGTSPSVVGGDAIFRLTVGTSASNSCTLTWDVAYSTNAPVCSVDPEGSAAAPVWTPSTTGGVLSGTVTSGGKYAFICGAPN